MNTHILPLIVRHMIHPLPRYRFRSEEKLPFLTQTCPKKKCRIKNYEEWRLLVKIGCVIIPIKLFPRSPTSTLEPSTTAILPMPPSTRFFKVSEPVGPQFNKHILAFSRAACPCSPHILENNNLEQMICKPFQHLEISNIIFHLNSSPLSKNRIIIKYFLKHQLVNIFQFYPYLY